MSLKQKAIALTLVFGFAVALCSSITASSTMAIGTQDNSTATTDSCSPEEGYSCCGEVKTSLIGGDVCGATDSKSTDLKSSAIWHILILVLNILTAGIGIAAVGGIVFGAILYTTAEDKPEQTKRAISIITNVVIGIVAYGLMYVLLNFLIPGGIFS